MLGMGVPAVAPAVGGITQAAKNSLPAVAPAVDVSIGGEYGNARAEYWRWWNEMPWGFD